MYCKIAFSDVGEKFARVNFIHPKDQGKNIVREAVAFPSRFVNFQRVSIPFDRFQNLLAPGSKVHIVWSKNLQKYVVRFPSSDNKSKLDSSSEDFPF